MSSNITPNTYVSLSKKTTKGAFWIITFSILSKIVTLVSQIALAWYLLPKQMGLVAMAFSITNIIAFISGTILKDILIQKQERFNELSSQVFWLSLFLNITICLLLFIIAPFSKDIFGNEQVENLIIIIAVSIPLQALSTIYASKIFIDLEFKKIAMLFFILGLVQNGTSVLFAALGYGAYSLTFPLIITALIAFIFQRMVAGKIVIRKIDFNVWPFLLKSSFWLMLLALFVNCRIYGINFIIGATNKATVAGYYFWGYTISAQLIFLISDNLKNILFPSFAKILEFPDRQFQAFQKAIKILLFLSGLIIGLQFILTRPLIELIFDKKWYPAIPVVEFLSLSIYFQPSIMLASSLLLSRGKFKELVRLNSLITLVILCGCTIGAFRGSEAEIAKWITVSSLVGGLFVLKFTYKFLDKNITLLTKTVVPQLIFFTLSITISYVYISYYLKGTSLIAIIFAIIIFLSSFLIMNYLFQKDTITEVLRDIFSGKFRLKILHD